MEKFIEFQRFLDIEASTELIDILESNQIEYIIDDSGTRFDMAASSISPLDNQIIVKIKESDFEKVNNLTSNITSSVDETINDNDHFLYSFSDIDIIDVIANPSDWNEEEVILAKQISKQRNLKPTAESIRSVRKDKITEDTKKLIETKNRISSGYYWFMWIAILSLINTINFAFNNSFYFIFGLGFTGLVDGFLTGFFGHYSVIGTIINIIISGVFVMFWYFAKKEKLWAFITGLVLYGLDTLLFIITNQWVGLAFHLFAFIGIYIGFSNLLQNKRKPLPENT